MSDLLRGGSDYVSGEASSKDVEFLHVPEGQAVVFLIISAKAFGCETHWIGGLRKPCLRTGCRGCAGGMLKQFRYWIDVLDIETAERGLLELGDRQKAWLLTARESGSLRSRAVRCSRTGMGKNFPINIESVENRYQLELPAERDIGEMLCRLWGIA